MQIQEFKNPITIEMDEYKELLMIAGRYEELLITAGRKSQSSCFLHPKNPYEGVTVKEMCETVIPKRTQHYEDECSTKATHDVYIQPRYEDTCEEAKEG